MILLSWIFTIVRAIKFLMRVNGSIWANCLVELRRVSLLLLLARKMIFSFEWGRKSIFDGKRYIPSSRSDGKLSYGNYPPRGIGGVKMLCGTPLRKK